jgi:hypothetical protein
VKIGYEGEGPRLGMKTLFLSPEDVLEGRGTLHKAVEEFRPAAVYANVNQLNNIKLTQLRRKTLEFPLTVECPFDTISVDFKKHEEVLFFLVADSCPDGVFYAQRVKNIFVKIRSFYETDFDDDLDMANKWAKSDFQVLLMPEWKAEPKQIGRCMMDVINKIHRNVRLMPPVQDLLEIA